MQEKGAPIQPKRDREDESTSNAQRAPDDQAGRLHPKNAAPAQALSASVERKLAVSLDAARSRRGEVALWHLR